MALGVDAWRLTESQYSLPDTKTKRGSASATSLFTLEWMNSRRFYHDTWALSCGSRKYSKGTNLGTMIVQSWDWLIQPYFNVLGDQHSLLRLIRYASRRLAKFWCEQPGRWSSTTVAEKEEAFKTNGVMQEACEVLKWLPGPELQQIFYLHFEFVNHIRSSKSSFPRYIRRYRQIAYCSPLSHFLMTESWPYHTPRRQVGTVLLI